MTANACEYSLSLRSQGKLNCLLYSTLYYLFLFPFTNTIHTINCVSTRVFPYKPKAINLHHNLKIILDHPV